MIIRTNQLRGIDDSPSSMTRGTRLSIEAKAHRRYSTVMARKHRKTSNGGNPDHQDPASERDENFHDANEEVNQEEPEVGAQQTAQGSTQVSGADEVIVGPDGNLYQVPAHLVDAYCQQGYRRAEAGKSSTAATATAGASQAATATQDAMETVVGPDGNLYQVSASLIDAYLQQGYRRPNAPSAAAAVADGEKVIVVGPDGNTYQVAANLLEAYLQQGYRRYQEPATSANQTSSVPSYEPGGPLNMGDQAGQTLQYGSDGTSILMSTLWGQVITVAPEEVNRYKASGYVFYTEEFQEATKKQTEGLLAKAKRMNKNMFREFYASFLFHIVTWASACTTPRHQPLCSMLGLFFGYVSIASTFQFEEFICMNPVVTLILAVCGRLSWGLLIRYLISHAFASFLAYAGVFMLVDLPKGVDRYNSFCAPSVTHDMISGVALEFFAAFFMAILVGAAVDFPKIIPNVSAAAGEASEATEEGGESATVETAKKDPQLQHRKLISNAFIASAFVLVHTLGAACDPSIIMARVGEFLTSAQLSAELKLIDRTPLTPSVLASSWILVAGCLPGAIVGGLLYRFLFASHLGKAKVA